MADRKRVLVVDDEPDVLLLCRVNLEFEGYEVVEASDGVEALEQMRATDPDLVLLDVMMPRLDGWQVLEQAKADPQIEDIPIVLLTAKVQDADQLRGFDLGAAEYITKPFSPLALSQTIEEVLAQGPEQREARRKEIVERLQIMHGR